MNWSDRVAAKLEELLRQRQAAARTRSAPGEASQADPGARPPSMSGPVLPYTETLIDHFANPRNVGELAPGEADGYALIGDPGCGDQMKLWIQVRDGRISQVRFRSFGCPGAIATSSMATELAVGRTLAEALALTDDDVVTALGGIPEYKRHCSLLGVNALHAAVVEYLERTGGASAAAAASPT